MLGYRRYRYTNMYSHQKYLWTWFCTTRPTGFLWVKVSVFINAGSIDHSSSEVKYSSYKIHSVIGDLENISSDLHENAVNVITSDFLSQSPYNETKNMHCTDGIGSALSPEYPWGTFSKGKYMLCTKYSFVFEDKK